MRFAPLLLLLLAACASDPAPDADVVMADTTTTAAPAASDTLAITVDDTALVARPSAPLRIEGACPFEGCTYGTWTTSADTRVFSAAGDTTSTTFTVPAGTALQADRGFVLITQFGTTAVTTPGELYLVGGETRELVPGDTLLVFDHQGEGSYRVWFDGHIGFSEAGGYQGPPGEEPALRQLTEPASQWWAHVTAPDGQSGWLWMDRTPDVEGADALGG